MFEFSRRFLIFFLVALSSFVLFFQLGHGSLTSWDEAIYGTIAREMLRSGDWLRPTFQSNLWLEKPPLCIWAITFLYHMFGINEFTVRFFSAACGFGTILITYLIGSKLFSPWIGFLSGMFLVTSKHFPKRARLGVMDAPLVFFMSLALLFFWLGRKKKIYFIFFGISLGLAFMIKGGAAFFVLPITWIYCWWANELFILKKPFYWLGILICAAVALPWNLYEILVYPQVYGIDLYTQIFRRITEAYEGHQGGFGYYFEVISSKYLPWVVLLPVALPFFILKAIRDKNKEIIFILVWIIFIFSSLTLVRTKLSWYFLPIYPAVSICVAYAFGQIVKEKYALLVGGMFLITAIGHGFAHFFKSDYNPDLKSISASVKKVVPEGRVLFLYHSEERHAGVFYTERGTTSLYTEEDFRAAAKQTDFYCLVHEKDMASLDTLRTSLHLTVRASAGKLSLLSSNEVGKA